MTLAVPARSRHLSARQWGYCHEESDWEDGCPGSASGRSRAVRQGSCSLGLGMVPRGVVGGAIPQNTDFRFTGFQEGLFSVLPATILATSEAVEAAAKDRSLESSLAGGAKAGACPPFFPYLCAELEFDYFHPDMAGQSPFQQPFRYIEDLLTRLPLARFDFHLETTPDSRMVPPLD